MNECDEPSTSTVSYEELAAWLARLSSDEDHSTLHGVSKHANPSARYSPSSTHETHELFFRATAEYGEPSAVTTMNEDDAPLEIPYPGRLALLETDWGHPSIYQARRYTSVIGSDILRVIGGNRQPEPSPTMFKHSAEWDCKTFVTAETAMTRGTFVTANSDGFDRKLRDTNKLRATDEYATLLRSRRLWPVDPAVEQDWSGRGQHAQFRLNERKLINELLEIRDTLGSTSSAVVQSVKCKRILLARKSITCGRRLTQAQVVEEVVHLTRLSNAHIVRVIGTYVIGKELSILMYPAARYNLESFILAGSLEPKDRYCLIPGEVTICLRDFFPCLSAAVLFIHGAMTKHMDIKPQNILVHFNAKPTRGYYQPARGPDIFSRFTVLLADFGIARSYDDLAAIETDSYTSYTPKYAAPEVVQQDTRGLPADIFSLGCVFLEMFLFLADDFGTINSADGFIHGIGLDPVFKRHDHCRTLEQLLQLNAASGPSYQANLGAVVEYIETLQYSPLPTPKYATSSYSSPRSTSRPGTSSPGEHRPTNVPELILQMLHRSAAQRPTADELVAYFGTRLCCNGDACQLEMFNDDDDN